MRPAPGSNSPPPAAPQGRARSCPILTRREREDHVAAMASQRSAGQGVQSGGDRRAVEFLDLVAEVAGLR
jgi:hypothetical protein